MDEKKLGFIQIELQSRLGSSKTSLLQQGREAKA